MAKPKRNADCHPDREHCAKGLCSPCYVGRRYHSIPGEAERIKAQHKERYAATRKRRRKPRPMATCHPNRPHLARGLCRACYYRQPGGEDREDLTSDQRKDRRISKSREYYKTRGNDLRRQRLADPEARARMRAKDKAWHKANPEKSAALAKAKKAKRRAAGRVKAADIAAALERQNRICFWCPAPLVRTAYHADHFIPVARGGNSNPENIVASCPSCNLSRRDKLPWEWQPERFKEGDAP